MAETEKVPMIYEALAAVMSEIGAIEKSKKNQQQGFMYRGIDDVMNALNPILAKHKVIIAPEILEQIREERETARGGKLIYSICTIKYTFFTTDGSNVSVTVIGEGMDSGDKATNKAMSIAYKYACFQMFCIPTEDMIDPDGDAPGPSSKKPKQTRKPKTKDPAPPEPPAPNMDAGKEKIPQVKIDALKVTLSEQGIKEETIFNLYKVKDLSELSENQHANIIKNISKIKQKQEEANE